MMRSVYATRSGDAKSERIYCEELQAITEDNHRSRIQKKLLNIGRGGESENAKRFRSRP